MMNILEKFEKQRKEQNIKLLKELITSNWIFENDPIIKQNKENHDMAFNMNLKNESEMADIYKISHSELSKLREEIRK